MRLTVFLKSGECFLHKFYGTRNMRKGRNGEEREGRERRKGLRGLLPKLSIDTNILGSSPCPSVMNYFEREKNCKRSNLHLALKTKKIQD